ncbi:alpha/beta fold hydrolase [Kitasatospora sp. NPDC050467]|uniref:alpha/beta fold hydrolase n=1 Tax=Kitasatospora sp. NPDC050467 TaxID=3364053 RepID=UPI00378DC0FA
MTDAAGTPDAAVTNLSSFTTGDGELAYRDAGTGRPVVLLHGGFLDHRMWDAQLAALTPEYRVIAPDVRGHGKSANATRPFRACDDLAALLRHLGTGPVPLVGVSMGAGIAVDTALEHPDLVCALVVSGAGTSEPDFQDPWTLGVLAEWSRALAAGDVDGWVDAFLKFLPGPHRSTADVDRDVLELQRAMALGTLLKHTADEPDHRVPVTGTWARAATIAVPVLAINGALDSADHLAMPARLIAAVPDGRTVELDGTAHYPNMERPEEFNAHLTSFLRAVARG